MNKPATQDIDADITGAEEKASKLYALLCARKEKFHRRQGSTTEAKADTIQCFANHIANNEPIPFMMYWAKGPYADSKCDEPKKQGIQFLHKHLSRLAEAYPPGIALNIVVADTHEALNENDVTDADMEKIRTLFEEEFSGHDSLNHHHVCVTRLSDIVPMPEHGMLEDKTRHSELWENPELLDRLAKRSARYFKGDRSDFDPQMAACRYYELLKMERETVGKAFSNHVFLTYNPEKQHWSAPPTGTMGVLGHNAARIEDEHGKAHTMISKPWNVENYQDVIKAKTNGVQTENCQLSQACSQQPATGKSSTTP